MHQEHLHSNIWVVDHSNIILKESQWFTPNYYEFTHYLKDMFEDYKHYKEKAVRQLNEVYQYLPKCYVKFNKGDYSVLNDLMQKYIYLVKFK